MDLPRILSKVERGDTYPLKLIVERASHVKCPYSFGVTGPPGSGKSTLINALGKALGLEGKKVAILALDPSSPFSGGSFLGDRIRMKECENLENVYIRSVPSEAYESLPSGILEMILTFSLFDFDLVFVETPGVGQTEIAIRDYVDELILVIPPYSGDDIQFLKSGILEVSSAYVINKADLSAAKETLEALKRRVLIMDPGKPIFFLSAKTGEGLDKLLSWINSKTHEIKGIPERKLVKLFKERAFRGIINKLKMVGIEESISEALGKNSDVEKLIEEVEKKWLKSSFS